MNDMTRPNTLPAVVTTALPMSPEKVRDHVNAIQKVMQAVMKEGVHFGKIPGTPKPTLYKPGAEVLCMAFHIDPNYEIDDLSTDDFYRYRVRCIGKHQHTEIKLGEGMGAASSNEEKYKWRKSICDEEFDLTPESRKRTKFGKSSDGGIYKVKQVRAEPDDIDNTVLKMACKRAHIAMVLNVLAASDIFTQDIEDLPEHLRSPDEPNPDLLAKWVALAAAAKDAEALRKVYDDGKAAMKALDDSATYTLFKAKVEELAKGFKSGPTLPGLEDAAFAKKLETWTKQVAKGQKPDDIIAMVRTKNTLTKEQEAAIYALAPKADAAPDPKGAGATIDKMLDALLADAADAGFAKARILKEADIKDGEAWTLAHIQRARAFLANPMGAPE